MICFDKLWELMRKKGVTRYELKDRYSIDGHTIKSLSDNCSVTTATLNKLCEILECRIEDIAEYKPDEVPIYNKQEIKPVRHQRRQQKS